MNTQPSRTNGKPVAAFVVSLLAGLWMLGATGMMTAGYGPGGMMGGSMMGSRSWGGMHTWMWHRGYMQGYWPGSSWSWIGILAGVVVVIGAAFLYARPPQQRGWGIAILVASAAALLTGTGFLPGILGIVGGILAISPRTAS